MATVDGFPTNRPAKTASKHILPLDGLRAVAIWAVLLYHLSLPYTQLGWAGVTLFFVLSGFLITGILLDNKTEPGYFRNFYARRALRIFPIYYLFVAVVAVGPLLLHRGNALYALAFLTYTQNYLLAYLQFELSGVPRSSHTWSLAIEEQFYLLWPLVVLRLNPKRLMSLCLALIIVAPLFRLLCCAMVRNPYWQNATLPGQMDALACGALAACMVRSGMDGQRVRRRGRTALWTGALIMTGFIAWYGMPHFGTPTRFLSVPSGAIFMSALNLLCFGIVLLVALPFVMPVEMSRGSEIANRILTLRPLTATGKISYGLYLYHPPVWFVVTTLAARRHITSTPVIVVMALLSVYLAAALSWRFIEAPILRLKRRFGPA